MQFFRAAFYFIQIAVGIGWQIAVQYLFYRRQLQPLLKKYFKASDATLPLQDKRRIITYAIYMPVLFGYGFSLLKGEKLSRKERTVMMLFAAATPLFDDFFDEENLSVQDLEKYFFLREKYLPKNSKEALLYQLLLQLKELLNDPESFVETCYKIFKAQQAALQQQQPERLPVEQLQVLTYDKGGFSALLFWQIIKEHYTPAEFKLIYHSGALLQLTDDVFDVWFDMQDHTQTLATNAASVAYLAAFYKEELNQLKTYALASGASSKQVKDFLRIQYFFFSRTFVALEQLQGLEGAAKGPFMPQNFTRKQLVCDMALWRNNYRWVQVNAELKKLIK